MNYDGFYYQMSLYSYKLSFLQSLKSFVFQLRYRSLSILKLKLIYICIESCGKWRIIKSSLTLIDGLNLIRWGFNLCYKLTDICFESEAKLFWRCGIIWAYNPLQSLKSNIHLCGYLTSPSATRTKQMIKFDEINKV